MKALSNIIARTDQSQNSNLNLISVSLTSSETVSKIIIEKIISLAITQTITNQQSNMLSSYCSIFTEKTLKTFINASQLFQDYETDNDLLGYSITQPSQSLIERDAGTQIHLDKLDGFAQQNINEQNSIDTIDNHKFDSSSPLTSRRFVHGSQSGIQNQHTISSKNLLLNLKLSVASTAISNGVKTKKTTAIDIEPSFDLPIRPFGKEYEIANIHKLRQERAFDLESQAKELQMMDRKKLQLSKSAANLQEDISLSLPQQAPLIEMKAITFDSNGKLIPLNRIPIENFKKDFGMPRTEIKEETIRLHSNNSSSLPNILIPDETVILTNINLPSTTNRKYKKDDPSKRIGIRYDYSGDNYEKIVPSPGVTVISQDESKSKKGEVNYHRDFKKLSMSDYRYLSEAVLPSILSPIAMNNPKEPNSNSVELSTNYNNYSKPNNSFKSNTQVNIWKPLGLIKYDKAYLTEKTLNIIQFKAKGRMSLSNVFADNTELTTWHEEHSLENKLRQKINFVPKRKETMIPLLDYEQINRFNKIILQDHNWGKHKHDNAPFNNKKIVIGKKNPIKRDHVMNDIPDYRTRKLFFRK